MSWKKDRQNFEVIVISEERQKFRGRIYRRICNGYYVRGSAFLHREVYKAYGMLPFGYDVHHIDGNKDNNNIDNLQAMPRKKHQELHKKWNEERDRALAQELPPC